MVRLAASAFGVLCLGLASMGCAQPIPVLHEGLDEVRYTRCVFKPNKEAVYSANYVGEFGGYPPGSPVAIRMFSAVRVDLSINNIPHQMFPASGQFNTAAIDQFLEKYFVSDLAEIGLGDSKTPPAGDNSLGDPLADDPNDGTGPETLPDHEDMAPGFRLDLMQSTVASSVKGGVAAVGMTKEAVLMAFGPPLQINFGTEAVGLPLKTILDANRWVYYTGWAIRSFTFGLFGARTYTFDGTKLIQVQ
jgi:hypothetical protein